MALTEEKVLESVEYMVRRKAINILWTTEIRRDGILIAEEKHRSALPVQENGKLSEEDEQVLGMKLSDIFGAAGGAAIVERDACEAQKNLLSERINNLSFELSEKEASVSDLNELIIQKQSKIDELLLSISNLEDVIMEQANQIKELESELEDSRNSKLADGKENQSIVEVNDGN